MPIRKKQASLEQEFDRQLSRLLELDYPAVAGTSPKDFMKQVDPLRARLERSVTPEKSPDGRIPFVLVLKAAVIPPASAMPLLESDGRRGYTSMAPHDLEKFQPIDSLQIPAGTAYLLVDVDTGKSTLNATPDKALEIIMGQERSPLTIDEGIAVVAQYPNILKANNAFYMLGSRGGDRRVTALWVSDGKPRLGWCWAGNPHTWLGSASCALRVGSART